MRIYTLRYTDDTSLLLSNTEASSLALVTLINNDGRFSGYKINSGSSEDFRGILPAGK